MDRGLSMMNFNPQNISLFVGQGCWKNLHHFEGPGGFKTRTPEQLISIIKEYLNKYKTKNFEFNDYCNVDLDDLNALCSLIIRHNLRFGWSAPAIFNPGMDRRVINAMARGGCKKLIFDLFSLPQPLLKEMKIMFEPGSASRILNLCRQEEISAGVNLFFGHPQETRQDFENTIRFISDNSPFINEIAKVTYCPSSFIFAASLETPLCRYWSQCLSLNKNNATEVSKTGFPDCTSKILNLGKPVGKIEPNEIIFKDLLDYRIDPTVPSPNSIYRGKIKVSYSEGGIHFFWNNIRITANVGLNIAINTCGAWVDSTRGGWQILEKENSFFKVKISFGALPISLVWQIKIVGDYKISWKLDMEIEKLIPIEEMRIVCLVDHRYSRWFNDYRQAEFPGLDNEWHDLCQEELPVSRVGLRPATQVALPLFAMEVKNKNIFSLVQNTPLRTKARIVGFRHKARKERKDYSPGHYVFEGEMGLSKIV